MDETREAVWEVLEELKSKPVTQAELERARRQVITGHIYGQETIEAQASRLASDEFTTGDALFSETYVERIRRVRAEDVQRVARRYLTPENLTEAILRPQGATGRAEEKAEPVPARAKVETFTLGNGLRVILRENHTAPLVYIQAVLTGGVRAETAETSGIGRMTAGLAYPRHHHAHGRRDRPGPGGQGRGPGHLPPAQQHGREF